MNPKDHIKEVCLLGSDRRSVDLGHLPEEIKAVMSQKNYSSESEKALEAITLWRFYDQAGGTALNKLKNPLVAQPIIEEKPYISTGLSKALKLILELENRHSQDALLPYWVDKVRDNGQIIVPNLCVPYFRLLDRFSKKIRNTATPTFGKKGNWLIQNEGSFERLTNLSNQEEADNDWKFGNKDVREAYALKMNRQGKINELKTLIIEGWEQENLRDKLWIIKLIRKIGCTPFIPFLEQLYNGEFTYAKKETKTNIACREQIAQCLLSDESTELHLETTRLLKNYFNKKGIVLKKIEANLPEQGDEYFSSEEMLMTYGINSTGTEVADFKNISIYYVSKLLSGIPFATWCRDLKTNYDKLLAFFLKNEQFVSKHRGQDHYDLLPALVSLAKTTKDVELIKKLIPHVDHYSDDEKELVANLTTQEWLNVVSNSDFQNLGQILSTYPSDKSWDIDFSKKLLDRIKDGLNKRTWFEDYTIAKHMVKYMPVSAAPYAQELTHKVNEPLRHLWDRHILQPLKEGLTIKKLIKQS